MNGRNALLAAAVLGSAALAAPGLAGGNQYNSTSTSQPCGDDSTVTFVGPLKLWPPNHKPVGFTITVTDDSGDTVSYSATASHDQILADGTEQRGSGNTDPATDISPAVTPAKSGEGTVSQAYTARAERSGQDPTGRTYSISYVATADDGGTQCDGTFTITVPHDMSEQEDREGRNIGKNR